MIFENFTILGQNKPDCSSPSQWRKSDYQLSVLRGLHFSPLKHRAHQEDIPQRYQRLKNF
jgi:hypothetical protein